MTHPSLPVKCRAQAYAVCTIMAHTLTLKRNLHHLWHVNAQDTFRSTVRAFCMYRACSNSFVVQADDACHLRCERTETGQEQLQGGQALAAAEHAGSNIPQSPYRPDAQPPASNVKQISKLSLVLTSRLNMKTNMIHLNLVNVCLVRCSDISFHQVFARCKVKRLPDARSSLCQVQGQAAEAVQKLHIVMQAVALSCTRKVKLA